MKIVKIIFTGLVFYLLAAFMFYVTEYLFMSRKTTGDFVQYFEIVPVVGGESSKGFSVDDPLLFKSFSVLKRPMKIDWYDALYCRKDDGEYRKLLTQHWPDAISEGRDTRNEGSAPWNYLVDSPEDDETVCRMCTRIISTTRFGKHDPYEFCSDEFEVNI